MGDLGMAVEDQVSLEPQEAQEEAPTLRREAPEFRLVQWYEIPKERKRGGYGYYQKIYTKMLKADSPVAIRLRDDNHGMLVRSGMNKIASQNGDILKWAYSDDRSELFLWIVRVSK